MVNRIWLIWTVFAKNITMLTRLGSPYVLISNHYIFDRKSASRQNSLFICISMKWIFRTDTKILRSKNRFRFEKMILIIQIILSVKFDSLLWLFILMVLIIIFITFISNCSGWCCWRGIKKPKDQKKRKKSRNYNSVKRWLQLAESTFSQVRVYFGCISSLARKNWWRYEGMYPF